jgi:hypothetical protein
MACGFCVAAALAVLLPVLAVWVPAGGVLAVWLPLAAVALLPSLLELPEPVT